MSPTYIYHICILYIEREKINQLVVDNGTYIYIHPKSKQYKKTNSDVCKVVPILDPFGNELLWAAPHCTTTTTWRSVEQLLNDL